MVFRYALLAATMLGAPTALAQPISGPYISLNLGAGYLQDQTLKTYTVTGIGTEVSGQVRTNVGGLASASVGYGLGNGLRIELQGDWGSDKLYHFGNGDAGGYQEQYHGFVNALYDFDLAPMGLPMAPYLGVGGGYGASHFTNVGVFGVNPLTGNANFVRSTGSADDYSVQGIAGVAFNVGAVPGLALTAEYRFTAQPSNQNYNGQYFEAGMSSRTHITNDGLYNHEALLGIRYALFQPPRSTAPIIPPPVVPPPEVQPARTYLVFFDWDRADLSARAREIVAQAAAASTHVKTTTIEVNGYTDLSGTAAYNQRLSVRRAESVEAELVRDGVPRSEIGIHGYGESNPLVPTAKGVREPQNRRVEIILH
jgi:outer membrane protein OmpA-like peptidoglycan-associated protein